MASPVLKFEGIEAYHINPDILELTVKIVPVDQGPRKQMSYGDVINSLCDAGIKGEEVGGIYKVSHADYSFSVLMADLASVEKIVSLQKLQAGRTALNIQRMTEQTITLRVHWLPLYYENSILKSALSRFGEITSINMLHTSNEKFKTLTGVREITMITDEVRRQNIPHLINFQSGQSCLITMLGRPPYCLKCQTVGHIRSRCPPKTFAGVIRNFPTAADARTPPRAPEKEASTGAGSVGPTPMPSSVDVVVAPVTADATATPANSGADGLGSGQPQKSMFDSDEEMGSVEKSSKRARDESPDDGHSGFFTPNKTARALSSSGEAAPLTLSTTFEALAGIENLMKSIEEAGSEAESDPENDVDVDVQ